MEELKYTSMINPEGTFNIVRENFMQLCILYTMTLGIFKNAFIEDQYYIFWDMIDDFFITLFFILDMILNFFTPYYTKDLKLEINCGKVSKNYLKGWFWLDLVSIIPFDLIFAWAGIAASSISTLSRVPKLIKIVRTAKMLRLFRVQRNKDNTILKKLIKKFVRKDNILSKVILTVIGLWLIAHFFAYLWFILSENSKSKDTWLYDQGYDTEGLWDQYIACFYYCISTFTTTGYGDIIPATVVE
jgi:hypothetical protein